MNYVWCNTTEDTGVHYIYFKHPDTKSQMHTKTNTSITQNLMKRCIENKSTNTPFVLNVSWMCRRAAAVTQWKFYRLWFMVVHLMQFVSTEWIVEVNKRGNKVSPWREEQVLWLKTFHEKGCCRGHMHSKAQKAVCKDEQTVKWNSQQQYSLFKYL